jgi:thioredoxin reductase
MSDTTRFIPATDPKSISGKPPSIDRTVDVLVVGGGPAGLEAAIGAAARGFGVLLVDENPVSFRDMGDEVPLHFGQGMAASARNRNAMMEAFIASEPRIAEAFEAGVDVRLGTACIGLYANGPSMGWLPGLVAGLVDGERSFLVEARHVILACGRRDMGLGFPGWEKPGVMGATAALNLATRYGALGPRRVVILGSSTEALSAALALRGTGVTITAIIEQAAQPVGDRTMLAGLTEGGAEFLPRHVLREAIGKDGVEAAMVARLDQNGKPACEEHALFCDGIVLAIGATPVIDLIDAAGCKVLFEASRGGYAPVLDACQRTSIGGIFAIGDCAGVWAAKSQDRTIAEDEARRAVAALGEAPDGEMAAPVPAPECDISDYRLAWVRASVIEARTEFHVCQCEEVTAREILEIRPPRYLDWKNERRNDRSLSALLGEGPPNPDQVKRLTRAGMGPCQGRRCREQVAALLALGAAQPLSAIPLAGYRAPVRPMTLAMCAHVPEAPEQEEHWDTWFGMNAQWRPFWEVPALYTVATNDATGPVASE